MFSSALSLAVAACLTLPQPLRAEAAKPDAVDRETSAQIQKAYLGVVEPIFRQCCFNCHSRFIKYPWNYSLPFVKKKIDEDLADARERLELSDGFPLESRKDAVKALKAVAKVIRRKSMPPFEYMLFHWGSALSDEENAKVLNWAEESLKKIMPEAK